MMQMMQHMMPGMAPPPGYMPGPYMQHMPYPMPPPNGAFLRTSINHIIFWLQIANVRLAMYPSTPMGQMPREPSLWFVSRIVLVADEG